MPLELQGTLLGLGSVVRLEREEVSGLFVVLARGAFRPDQELPGVEPRYLVAPHPFGEAPDQETFPVLARDVQEVVFEGYFDSDDDAFLADLLEQMEHGRRPSTPAQQFTGALSEISVRADDAAAAVVDVAGGELAADPFSELRRLTGHNYREDEQ